MALRITDREVNGVSVLDMDGRIVLREESSTFRERFRGLMNLDEKARRLRGKNTNRSPESSAPDPVPRAQG